jgi:hypothetical protein
MKVTTGPHDFNPKIAIFTRGAPAWAMIPTSLTNSSGPLGNDRIVR